MKITAEKVIRKLEKNYGWHYITVTNELLIEDVLKVIFNEL